MMTRFSVLIPVYNRQEMTLKCLEHLYQSQDLRAIEVVVIDDGSTDKTRELVRAFFPDVVLLETEGNLWWTGAIRRGMEYAISQERKGVIWLNNDCFPDENTLNKLIDYIENSGRSTAILADVIVGASCYNPENNQLIPTGFYQRKLCSASENQVIKVQGLSGYCVAIPAKIITAIGFPDSYRFPQYGGDGSYTFKAWKKGYQVLIIGDAKAGLPDHQDTSEGFISYCQKQENKSFLNIFFGIKSPYFWRTQFYYFQEKYSFLGLFLWLGKMLLWMIQWLRLKLILI